ncbi:transposase [Thermoplasma acidophilum]|uniref:transposase n=1 Tax=Thermoplasma acidophilum TaxID=2303 RepID=UPI00373AED58
MSEINDIHRFSSKEKLAPYAGLVPRQNQSGSNDLRVTYRGMIPPCSGSCL